MNKFRWYLKRNLYIFVQENALENIVGEMFAICLDLNALNPHWQT